MVRTALTSRLAPWAAIACVLVSSIPAAQAQDAADAVTGMCLDAGKTPDICECASTTLYDEIGDDAYVIYERVGSAYLADMAQGTDRADAWMAAIEAENLELATSNTYGKAHRDAMNGCEP